MAEETIVVRDGRKYKTLVTDLGRAKIALAALEGRKVNIIEMALGDGGGSYYLPTSDATTLKNVVWCGEIANKEINKDSPNMIDVRTVLDSTVGGFTVREAALYDDEGDMIVVSNLPDIEKAIILEGISSSLTILLHVVFSNVEAVEITVNKQLDAVSKDEMERAIQSAVKSSVAVLENIVIPTTGWTEGTADQEEPDSLHVDIPLEGVTEKMIPFLTIYRASQETTKKCELNQTVQTLDGFLRVYAKKVPTQEMTGSLTLLCASSGVISGTITGGSGEAGEGYQMPIANRATLGGVKVGNGLSVTPDGTLSVNPEKVLTDDALVDEDEMAQSIASILNGDVDAK